MQHQQYGHKKSSQFSQASKGFTLVELMIVVVILSIFAGIVSISVGAGANRKNMQRYDLLVDDLKLARLLALEQQKVLGLKNIPANGIHPTRYMLVTLNDKAWQKLVNQAAGQVSTQVKNRKFGKNDGLSVDMSAGLTGMTADDDSKTALWQPFKTKHEAGIDRKLTEQIQLRIEPLEQAAAFASGTPESDNPMFANQNGDSPQIIWFGNGESTPVKITVFVADTQVGNAIFIDKLGRVTTDSSKAGL